MTSEAMPTWSPFFRELTARLLEYESRQPNLVELLQRAGVKVPDDQGEPLREIDPLSALSLISKHSSHEKLTQVLTSLREQLALRVPVPTVFTGMPNSDPRSPLLFPYRDKRRSDDIPSLWRLAREAVEGRIQPETFARALDIENVGLSKLTMGLFWMDTDRYLALNSKNLAYLSRLGFPDAADVATLAAYQATLERARDFAPSFTDLSHAAWLSGKPVQPPQRFPLQDLQNATAAYRAELTSLSDTGEDKKAEQALRRAQIELHERFGSQLRATVQETPLEALVLDDRRRYTGSQFLSLRLAFHARPQPGGEGLWFGNLYLSADSDDQVEKNTLGAYFGLAHGVDETGQETVRRALQRPEAMKAFLDALTAVEGLPTAPQLTIVRSVWPGPDLTLTGTPTAELERALHLYAASIGKPRKLEVLVKVPPDVLTSDDYPDVMATVMGYLEGIAVAIDTAVKGPGIEEVVAERPAPPTPAQPLNVILYGPPGTGKTYSVARLALERLDPEFLATEPTRKQMQDRLAQLQADGRAVFTTFHQNYAYEDFIEGIRPEPADDGSPGVTYRVKPGLLKLLAERASTPVLGEAWGELNPDGQVKLNPDGQVWKLSLDWASGSSTTRQHCLDHGEARIGYAHVGRFDQAETLSGAPKAFYEGVSPGDLLLVSAPQTHVQAVGIVTGEYRYEEDVPADVGAEYRNVRAVTWIASGLDVPFKEFLKRNFSPNTMYHLDVRVPEVMTFLQREGALKTPVVTAEAPPAHVLIIDEINRGNVAKIFGELITLLEPSKRLGGEEATTVELPYSKKPFALPSNLYLIGTMNTADQSLARLDTALRRRFEFVEMFPRPESLAVTADGIDLRRLLYAMNRRLTLLQGRDYTIGHAYFARLDTASRVQDVAAVFRLQVLPLLEEYFFDDWSKIRAVLNDAGKAPNHQLIVPEEPGAWLADGDAAGTVYRVQASALTHVEAFTGIYAGKGLEFPFDQPIPVP